MPGIERFIAPVVGHISLIASDIHRVRELQREIRRNDEYGRSLEYNPDGSIKSVAEFTAEAKRSVLT